MADRTYTALFPFGGSGGGALGFQRARSRLFGTEATFRVLGGIDFDAHACADFELLTGVPELCADVDELTPEGIREQFGADAPDCVFLSPPCLPSDGLVVTPRGTERIDSMRVGHLVLSHTGHFRRVLKVGSHVYNGTMFGFRLNGTVDTHEFTAEHPLWVRRNCRVKSGSTRVRGPGVAKFIRAAEVRVGDRIGFPIDHEVPGTAEKFIATLGDPTVGIKGGRSTGRYSKTAHMARLARVRHLGEHADSGALWFLLGAYLGDGYRRAERHEVIFCVGAAESVLAKTVRASLASLNLGNVFEDQHGGRGNVKLRVQAKHLSLLCGAFGDGAEHKRIPPVLFGVERPCLDALIAGYRATDGSSRPRRFDGKRVRPAKWKIASVSLQLLRDVQRMLLRRAEFGAIHVAWPGGPQVIMGREVQTLPRWEISVAESGRRGTYDFIGGAVWVRVRKRTERRACERVWNLEVETDNTFCAPMIATHNCKGASGLLSAEKARSPKYQKMNELALRWVELMLRAWPVPPKLVLLENVPRLKQRAGGMLRKVRAALRAAGYVFHDGFHECGEIGGLAQVRKRYLLVARHAQRVPPLLYQPPKKRVRACGEVLGELPLPGAPEAGPMHALPKLSWLNWVRLALIPAGGDWRDLEGVLREGQPRREVFKRHGVQRWAEPSATVAGSGSNGPCAVADPRVPFGNVDRVTPWTEPVGTVTHSPAPSSGGGAVADPRFPGALGVTLWSAPSSTITGESYPSNGSSSVGDPRLEAVLRVDRAYDHGYGVLRWDEPSSTVAAGSHPGQGAYSVADIRFKGEYYRGYYGVLSWQQAAGTITGNARIDCGKFAVSDPRKPPPFTPVIIAADGTWHRPLTTLELAALQGFPTTIDGKPLVLSGKSISGWRERIGNAVPPPAAQAIAERMLVCLLQADCEGFALAGSDTPVWVEQQAAL